MLRVPHLVLEQIRCFSVWEDFGTPGQSQFVTALLAVDALACLFSPRISTKSLGKMPGRFARAGISARCQRFLSLIGHSEAILALSCQNFHLDRLHSILDITVGLLGDC